MTYKNSNCLKKHDSCIRKKPYNSAYDKYSLVLREDLYSIILQIKLSNTKLKFGHIKHLFNLFYCMTNPEGAYRFLKNLCPPALQKYKQEHWRYTG